MIVAIKPYKDATLYEEYPDKNTGLDEILEKRRKVFNRLCEKTGKNYDTDLNWLAFPLIVENRLETIKTGC